MITMALSQPPSEPELATKEDVRRVDEKVDRVDEKVDRVEEKVDKLDRKVDRIDKRLDRLENRFARLEEKLDMTLTVMREHMASKRDVEHMGRITTIWMVGAIGTLIAAMLATMSGMIDAVASLAR